MQWKIYSKPKLVSKESLSKNEDASVKKGGSNVIELANNFISK